jgi:hypothetical protein
LLGDKTDKEKKSLSIYISDLDDFNKVVKLVDHLLDTLIKYYIDTNSQYLRTFVLSMAIYIGKLMIILGLSEKDIPSGD